ncbi:MAG TPA: hypothetical protein VD994_16875, partial [Prosthecobacter sp.]|nr:hypothetical protein [Prosthecobacter sp.]
DDEDAELTLTVPASVPEGAANVPASLAVDRAPTRDLEVTLISSHGALVPPASLVIPAGSTGPVNFVCEAPENGLVDGSRQAILTATVMGWAPVSRQLVVTDNDVPALILTGGGQLREGDPVRPMTLTVNALSTKSLTVKLISSDTTEVTVPASVILPAGQWSVSFNATIVNDTLADGTQQSNLTASVAGYAETAQTIRVADNEVDRYSFNLIPSPQRIKKPIAITITARDIEGAPITNHVGVVTLKATAAFTQTPLSAFSGGVAFGTITVSTKVANMVMTATDSRAKTGSSNPFDVEPGVHESFAWSGMPTATVAPDTLFAAKVTALDDGGNAASNYTSLTTIEAYVPVLDRKVGSTLSSGATTQVYNTLAHDSRAQMIYTAAELGAEPRWIGALQTYVAAAAGQAMRTFTIRLKHSPLESFEGQSWDDSGWTTVYTSASAAAGISYFPLINPFYYDGVQNLMVDISFNNTTATSAGSLQSFSTAAKRMLSGTSNSTHGDPLKWNQVTGPMPTLSQELPVLQFYVIRSLGPIPGSPVAFANGAWSGTAFAPAAGFQAVWLLATAPSGIFAFSPRVLLSNPASPVASTGVVFSDGFESGVLGPAWSTANSSGVTARARITTAGVPKGRYHLTMDTTSVAPGPYARNSLTLTVNLAGKKNVMLDWQAKGFGDEPHAPTLAGPLGSFDSEMDFDGVAVSADGVTWVEAAPLRGLPSIYPTTASRVFLDPIVQRMGWDYHETFQIRFSHCGNQAMNNDGVALDDITIRANPATVTTVDLPPNIAEGLLNVPVAVTLPAVRTTDTPVKLVSNSPARLTITATVTIPAGQTRGTAFVSAPQNQFADIGKDVVVTATATGVAAATCHTRVVDDERPELTVRLPQAVLEGESPVSGLISMTPMVTSAVPVFLTSSDHGKIVVSPMITIPFGAEAVPFSIQAVDDTFAAGSQAIAITATGQGLRDGSAVVEVVDDEGPGEGLAGNSPAP